MKLLDKFRAQPEWQSDDPAVRTDAVRDLSDGEAAQELLIEIAHHDDDPGVRREAVIRITDLVALVEILNTDPDPTVCTEAQGVVRELLIEAEDRNTGELGLRGLSDERDLVAVARSARLESVSRMALAKLSEPRALGMVARRSTRGEIASEALSRLDASEELLAVAVKAEDKAIAVRAFERLTDGHLSRDILQQIGKQAKQKAVRRRALAALSALDEAIVQPKTAREIARRFAHARATAEGRLAEIEARELAARESVQRQARVTADREALCARIEALDGAVSPEMIRQFREQWGALAGGSGDRTGSGGDPLADSALSALEQRFERALVKCQEQQRELARFQTHLQSLEKVIGEMERLLESGGPPAAVRWTELDRELDRELGQANLQFGSGLSVTGGKRDGSTAMQALQRRYDAIQERRRELVAEAEAERERAQQENLARVLQRISTVEGLITSEKLKLAEAERQLRAVRRVLDDPGPLPRHARESTTRKLKRAHTRLLGRVRELRDFADWQRWANLGIQEELCRRMEALAEASETADATGLPGAGRDDGAPNADDASVANQFLDIMAKWRQASDVPKDRGAEVWTRFKTAHDAVFARCQKHFEAQDTARERNLVRQRAVVEEAEQLALSSDWIRTLQRITALQDEWKALKPVPRTEQRELWNRFRTACNSFFGRRKADLADRKKAWSHNLSLKEALCDRVETLAEAEDLHAAVVETKQAQKEWKSIGPVRRNHSDAVWKRFRTACDRVFDRVRAMDRDAAVERAGVREALCVELEALLPADGSGAPPDDLADAIRDLQRRWREAPEVPHRLGRELTDRLTRGIARLVEVYPTAFAGTDLDPVRKRKRLEKLCERIEGLEPTETLEQAGASPSEILASKWREALASNLMGARVDTAAERRAALDEVKRAQAECRRLGSPVGDEGRKLLSRFHVACDAVVRWADPKRSQRPKSKSKTALASGT